jgi:hypothetical protein
MDNGESELESKGSLAKRLQEDEMSLLQSLGSMEDLSSSPQQAMIMESPRKRGMHASPTQDGEAPLTKRQRRLSSGQETKKTSSLEPENHHDASNTTPSPPSKKKKRLATKTNDGGSKTSTKRRRIITRSTNADKGGTPSPVENIIPEEEEEVENPNEYVLNEHTVATSSRSKKMAALAKAGKQEISSLSDSKKKVSAAMLAKQQRQVIESLNRHPGNNDNNNVGDMFKHCNTNNTDMNEDDAIPEAVLQKIRQRELRMKQDMESVKRCENRQLLLLCEMLRSFYSTENRSVMNLDIITAKIQASCSNRIPITLGKFSVHQF